MGSPDKGGLTVMHEALEAHFPRSLLIFANSHHLAHFNLTSQGHS